MTTLAELYIKRDSKRKEIFIFKNKENLELQKLENDLFFIDREIVSHIINEEKRIIEQYNNNQIIRFDASDEIIFYKFVELNKNSDASSSSFFCEIVSLDTLEKKLHVRKDRLYLTQILNNEDKFSVVDNESMEKEIIEFTQSLVNDFKQ